MGLMVMGLLVFVVWVAVGSFAFVPQPCGCFPAAHGPLSHVPPPGLVVADEVLRPDPGESGFAAVLRHAFRCGSFPEHQKREIPFLFVRFALLFPRRGKFFFFRKFSFFYFIVLLCAGWCVVGCVMVCVSGVVRGRLFQPGFQAFRRVRALCRSGVPLCAFRCVPRGWCGSSSALCLGLFAGSVGEQLVSLCIVGESEQCVA